jgi:flagellar protein FlbD
MIQLTRINHVPLVLNSDLIEHIEAAPDTIISLTNGQKLVVLESIDDIVRRVIDFRRAVCARASEANFTSPEFTPSQSTPSQSTPSQSTPSQSTPSQSTPPQSNG